MLSFAGVAGAVYLVVVTSRRYGFGEVSRNIASKPGAMLTGGVLVLAGCVAGILATFVLLAALHNRHMMNQELTKMFERPPDRRATGSKAIG